jgi:hypothetical protein
MLVMRTLDTIQDGKGQAAHGEREFSMNPRSVKVSLTADNMVSFFSIYDHCGIRQYVDADKFQDSTEITCTHCEEPVMLRGTNGLWYFTGERVFP